MTLLASPCPNASDPFATGVYEIKCTGLCGYGSATGFSNIGCLLRMRDNVFFFFLSFSLCVQICAVHSFANVRLFVRVSIRILNYMHGLRINVGKLIATRYLSMSA